MNLRYLKDSYEVSSKAKVCTQKRGLGNGCRANEKICKICVPKDYENTEVEPSTPKKAREGFSEEAILDLNEKMKGPPGRRCNGMGVQEG